MKISPDSDILFGHTLPENQGTERLRIYAREHFADIYPTGKSVKKAIKKGLFHVNGLQGETGTLVKGGDLIELVREELNFSGLYPLELPIIYADDHFAVINKPSGLPVHGHSHRTLIHALPYNLPTGNKADSLPHALPVHRLDSLTSGLLIVARTRRFHKALTDMLAIGQVTKRYTAILLGETPSEARFNTPIEGLHAHTELKLIRHITSKNFGSLSLVQLFPVTGRTHQIRVHCAEAGHPVLGERLYARHMENLKGRGLFLCATAISFRHPLSGEKVHFEIEPHKKFSRYFK